MVQTTLGLETQQPPALPTQSRLGRSPEISGNDILADLMEHEVRAPSARTQRYNSEAVFKSC
jgi:hypothetical protein